MKSLKIRNATRSLGKPRDWNEAVHGPCDTLEIRDGKHNGQPTMTSAWKLSEAELEVLKDGGAIYLMVVGEVHPPVALYVDADPTVYRGGLTTETC